MDMEPTGTSPPRRPDRGRAGFTVVEMIVSVAVLALLFVALGTCLASSIVAERETMASAIVDDIHRNVFDRLAFELRYSGNLALTPTINATSLTYEPIVGWAGAAPDFDPPKTLQFQSGQLLLDNQVIASGITSVAMNLNGSLLTVTVTIDPATYGAGTGTAEVRQLSAQLKVQG